MNNSYPVDTTPIEDIDTDTFDVENVLNNLLTDIEEDTNTPVEQDDDEEEEADDEEKTTPVEAVSPTPVTENVKETVEEEEEEESEINEKRNPIVRFFNYELDLDSMIVHLLIIFIWLTIWFGTGLRTMVGKDIIFSVVFMLFLLYNIVSIFTAGKSSGGVVYELNILLTVEQMVSILLGAVILFTLFYKNLPMHPACAPIINKLCISNVVLLTLSSLWVSVWTSGRAFRSIRKFKQGIYNIALMIMIIVGLLFLRGECNGSTKK